MWGDLGASQMARLERLEGLVAKRQEQAKDLLQQGDQEGANSALTVAGNLRKAADKAREAAEAAFQVLLEALNSGVVRAATRNDDGVWTAQTWVTLRNGERDMTYPFLLAPAGTVGGICGKPEAACFAGAPHARSATRSPSTFAVYDRLSHRFRMA